MICPILAIASTLDKDGNSPCECQKECCAMWVVVERYIPPQNFSNVGRTEYIGHCGLRKD